MIIDYIIAVNSIRILRYYVSIRSFILTFIY